MNVLKTARIASFMLCIFCHNLLKKARGVGADDLAAPFLFAKTSEGGEKGVTPRARSLRVWPPDKACGQTTLHLCRTLCFSKETRRQGIVSDPHHSHVR